MHGSNSGLAYGTSGSPQTTLEQQEYAKSVAEAEAKVKAHQDYLKNELPRTSPLKIAGSASIKEEQKHGYNQVKYSWQRGKYKYSSRWHTRTPNAPKNQGDSWVVERRIPGIGNGPNARRAKTEILVGKSVSGRNIWVDKRVWDAAVYARAHGTCTKKQKEMLDHGHWKA
jgi:hypothetical protein